jgi:hypothetical protein
MIDTCQLVRAKCIRPAKTKNGPTVRRANELGMGREYRGYAAAELYGQGDSHSNAGRSRQ